MNTPPSSVAATATNNHSTPLSWKKALLSALGAIGCFHLAWSFNQLSFLIVGFLWCLLQLSNLPTPRQAFYTGLAVGLAIYAPQLSFFWNIFKAAAIPLWLVLSFWIALFLLLAHFAQRKLSRVVAAILIPVLWVGLELFRSELYYLRFSWLSAGYVFSSLERATFLSSLGVYGLGFVLMVIAVLLSQKKKVAVLCGAALWIAVGTVASLGGTPSAETKGAIRVSGVQLEFREEDVITALDRVFENHPNTDLYVLSEYMFSDLPPKPVRNWCRDHKVHLVAGGKEFLEDGKQFYNTAFVIGPDGQFIFKQVKSVPIQFFKDGLPAPKQELWNSPWGKIGICICYDLSYRRVVDNLIAQGAQALVVPTMDVIEWGQHQHELHGRIGPTRAAEYSVPVFRLCSSGISQAIDAQGKVLASASFPGEGEILSAKLNIREAGRRPVDHWLAPVAAGITGLFILWLCVSKFFPKRPNQENI